jgi:hypothetical protein
MGGGKGQGGTRMENGEWRGENGEEGVGCGRLSADWGTDVREPQSND